MFEIVAVDEESLTAEIRLSGSQLSQWHVPEPALCYGARADSDPDLAQPTMVLKATPR